jgi:hypothetical protein
MDEGMKLTEAELNQEMVRRRDAEEDCTEVFQALIDLHWNGGIYLNRLPGGEYRVMEPVTCIRPKARRRLPKPEQKVTRKLRKEKGL